MFLGDLLNVLRDMHFDDSEPPASSSFLVHQWDQADVLWRHDWCGGGTQVVHQMTCFCDSAAAPSLGSAVPVVRAGHS